MNLVLWRARKAAPDITAYRGQSGRGVVKTQARDCLELLRSAGVNTNATLTGEGSIDTSQRMALGGYRAVEDGESIRETIEAWASSSLNCDRAVSLLLTRRSGELTCIYHGIGVEPLCSALPDARVKEASVQHTSLLLQCVVTGVPGSRIDYDAVLDATNGSDIDIEAILLPSPSAARVLDELSNIRGIFEPHREAAMSAGAGRGTTSVREVADLLGMCDRMQVDLMAHPQRARLVFRVCADDVEALGSVVNTIKGGCHLSERNPYKMPLVRRWTSHTTGSYPLVESGEAFAYEMAVEDAVGALLPPKESHAGFSVSLSSLASDRRAFPGVGITDGGEAPSYTLGTCENDGRTVKTPMYQVPSAFVTGVPGTGKTTLLLNMIVSAAECGIPFCAIEASTKREFAGELIATVPNVEVLGIGPPAGNTLLRINPLWVAPGTLIDSHCQNVAAALLMAATGDDQEAPIPQAMEALVKEAYRRYGWKPSDVAYERVGGYPTLADLDVESYTKRLVYELRVKMNVAQALDVRIDHLMTHREMLCSKGDTDFWRITGGRTVLELGALGERSAALVATCQLRHILEWASSLPDLQPGVVPRLVVVIDEVNAILSYEGEGRPFSTLLERAFRELRAKGIVLICAGQQAPSVDVGIGIMANAALRVAFRSDWQQDAINIAGALGLEEYQTMLLGTLPAHHAVVKLPNGSSGVIPVATNPFSGELASARHAACLSCSTRMSCARCRATATQALHGVPPAAVVGLRDALLKTPFDPMAIGVAKLEVEKAASDAAVRHCLTGLCLEKANVTFDVARFAFVDVIGRSN